MEDLKIVRKNITANTIEKFEFDVEGFEFLVKNFSDYDIYVVFKFTNNKSKMIKIPTKCDQVCLMAKGANIPEYSSKDVYIYAENSGEVEVQCVKF